MSAGIGPNIYEHWAMLVIAMLSTSTLSQRVSSINRSCLCRIALGPFSQVGGAALNIEVSEGFLVIRSR